MIDELWVRMHGILYNLDALQLVRVNCENQSVDASGQLLHEQILANSQSFIDVSQFRKWLVCVSCY